jgi:serine/threonine-protein kinase RsbW
MEHVTGAGLEMRRMGGSPLAIELVSLPPYTIGIWRGVATEATLPLLGEAGQALLALPAAELVLDLSSLRRACLRATEQLAILVGTAQRQGYQVCLVRCSAELFRAMQGKGLSGAVTHSGSVAAATHGQVGDPVETVELHLRSVAEVLPRLRSVAHEMASRAAVNDLQRLNIQYAVLEAATNAIVHGSPEGARNHVRIVFELTPQHLIVDISDQGPGFDPGSLPPCAEDSLSERGLGLRLMHGAMDRVEFFRDDGGLLVRLTKVLARRGGGEEETGGQWRQ